MTFLTVRALLVVMEVVDDLDFMHGRAAQIMLEQDVQTYITWTHGAQPTWLQFHGPGTLLDRPVRLTASPPTPPRFPILLPPPPPPPPPPPVILHPQFMPSLRASSSPSPRGQSCPATMKSQRTRRSIRSADQFRDDDLRSLMRSPKRSRTTSASATRRSRRPFTVFPSKRATRPSLSSLTSCKHYCHAFLHHGRKCLSPCAPRRPGHYHCRCVRHQRR